MKFFRRKEKDTPNISCLIANVVTKMEFKVTLNNEKEIAAFKTIIANCYLAPTYNMNKEYINLVKQLSEIFD